LEKRAYLTVLAVANASISDLGWAGRCSKHSDGDYTLKDIGWKLGNGSSGDKSTLRMSAEGELLIGTRAGSVCEVLDHVC
jgi:hypothetical protein